MDKLESIKKFFEKDRFVLTNGIEIIELGEDFAVCEANIEDRHLNANDVVQGGMLYTLADFTFAVLANHLHPVTVTQTASITYLSPCKNTKKIRAVAKETALFGHNSVSEVKVYDDKDTVVAIATVNGFRK